MATLKEVQFSDEVLKANHGFAEHLKDRVGDIRVHYDAESDILFLNIGEAQEGVMEPTSDEFLYLRLDPETLRIIGFAVTSFRSRFIKQYPELERPTELLFMQPAFEKRQFPVGSPQGKRTVKILRELVTA